MKGMKKTRGFVFLAAALLAATAALAGCSKKQAANTVKQTWETVSLNLPGEPWLKPYPEPVVLTTANNDHTSSAENSAYNDFDNLAVEAFRKYLNIDLRPLWVSSDYSTKINLAMASKDLPDVFATGGSQFDQLMEAGLLEDISGAFNQNLSARSKAIYDFDPYILSRYMQDGNIYGFPRLNWGNIGEGTFMWFRKDWMAELGFSGDPKTIDEMMSRVEAMNKRYGTRGLAVEKSLNYGFFGLAPMWHVYPKIWVTGSGGTLVYGSVVPEMKTVLAAFADWYKRGLINPNFAVEDQDAVKADVVSGKYGAHPFGQWLGWYTGPDMVNNYNRDAFFEPYALPSIDGKPELIPVSFSSNVHVVRKGYARPEAVAQIINFYNFINFDAAKAGVIDQATMDFFSGSRTLMPIHLQFPMVDYDGYYEAQKFKQTGDWSVFTNAGTAEKVRGILKFTEAGDPKGDVGSFLQLYNDRSSYGINAGKVERDEYIRNKLWGASPEAVSKYGSTLDDLLLEGFTQIILGNQPVSYFDTLVQEWYAQGGREVSDAVNAMYGKK